MEEITGTSKSTTGHIIQQQEELRDKWTLHHGQQETSQKRKCEGKDPDVEEDLSELFHHHNWARCMYRWPSVEKQVREPSEKAGS
jgi:hypothetical protein